MTPAPMGVRPELRHYRAFLAVAEELNFTRAAKRLYLAQQALSLQVRQLEEALGVRLFERTTRSVSLTIAGDALLGHVQSAFAELETGAVAAQEADGRQARQVRMGYSSFLPFVEDIVAEATADDSDAHIIVREMWCEEAAAALRQGTLDIAYVWTPPADPGLASSVVRRLPVGVIVGVRHPLAEHASIDVQDLEDTRAMMMPRAHFPGLHVMTKRLFPRHFERDMVYEYSKLTHNGFADDPVARREAAAGRVFLLAHMFYAPPEGFVIRPLQPRAWLAMYMVHKPVVVHESRRCDHETLLERMIRLSSAAAGRQPDAPMTAGVSA